MSVSNVSEVDFKKFYDAIVGFEESEECQDTYYTTMDSLTGRSNADGSDETVRQRILKAYGMLFCEDTGLKDGEAAGVDDVADTADRLYIGTPRYDSDHWYRMKYHFPVIDEDNYDRFAALVIADLRTGPLHEAALSDGETLVVGEADPLKMTREQRKSQRIRNVALPKEGAS